MQPPPLPGYPAPPPAAAMPPPAAPAFAMPPAYAAPAPAPQGYPGPAVAAPAHYHAPAGVPAPALAPAVGMPQPGQPFPAYAQPAPAQAAPAPNPYAPAPAPQPGPNPFFGIPLPGERHPDVPLGNHVLDVEKLRISEDRTGVIFTFKVAGSDVLPPGETVSKYVNLYGYRSQALSGELIKILLACVGCSTYEQLTAAGPERTAMYVAIGQRVIAGEENAITNCRLACFAYQHSPKTGDNVGKTYVRCSWDAYRQAA